MASETSAGAGAGGLPAEGTFPPPADFSKWIEDNRHLFKPPVGNKLMYGAGQHKIMCVGGPNVRKDYHLELGEEFFYQLQGDMVLEVMEKGVPKPIKIKEGEVFMLPSRIPHSPQRPADTIGLVIERERLPTELDGLRWYVDGTSDVLYQEFFHCFDLGSQLKPVVERFFASEEGKTGVRSGRPIPETPFELDTTTTLPEPINLQAWIAENAADKNAYLYGGPESSGEYNVLIMSQATEWSGEQRESGEVFFYVLSGSTSFTVVGPDAKETPVTLNANDVLLLPVGHAYKGAWSAGCVGMIVTNDVVAPREEK